MPQDLPPEINTLTRISYLAGARAAFNILAGASELSQEEAIAVWKGLSDEMDIAAKIGTPDDPRNMIAMPPEKKIIM